MFSLFITRFDLENVRDRKCISDFLVELKTLVYISECMILM